MLSMRYADKKCRLKKAKISGKDSDVGSDSEPDGKPPLIPKRARASTKPTKVEHPKTAASSSQKKLLNILNGSGTPTSGMMVDLRSDKSPSLGKGKLLFHHIVFAPHSYLLFVLQASSLLQMPT